MAAGRGFSWRIASNDTLSRSRPMVSTSNSSISPCPSRAPSRLRSIMAGAGSSPFEVNAASPRRSTYSGASPSPKRRIRARSPMPPGKLIRYGVSAATNTAWLGVPITCRPGASCLANTPASGSTTALRSCRSTSPQASETPRASNRPICSVALSNMELRVTGKDLKSAGFSGVLSYHGTGFFAPIARPA